MDTKILHTITRLQEEHKTTKFIEIKHLKKEIQVGAIKMEFHELKLNL